MPDESTAHLDPVRERTVFVDQVSSSLAVAPAEAAPIRTATQDEIFSLVYRQMRTLAGHRDLEELAQTAAEQALRGLARFEGRCELSTWTYRICYLTVRKHDRWYRRWLKRFTLTTDGALPEPAAETTSMDQRLVERERGVRLRQALESLSANRRAVVVLHDLEGRSIEEVAAIVGAAPVAVRSRLRDARKALGVLLARDEHFGDKACSRGRAR